MLCLLLTISKPQTSLLIHQRDVIDYLFNHCLLPWPSGQIQCKCMGHLFSPSFRQYWKWPKIPYYINQKEKKPNLEIDYEVCHRCQLFRDKFRQKDAPKQTDWTYWFLLYVSQIRDHLLIGFKNVLTMKWLSENLHRSRCQNVFFLFRLGFLEEPVCLTRPVQKLNQSPLSEQGISELYNVRFFKS